MAWFGGDRDAAASKSTALVIDGLDVYYGRAHALQGVSLTLERGVLGIVGRNGMGKTTLCNAITGMVPARGSIRFAGEEILGMAPNEITKRGIAYVPQGRRVWPSLSVDETLRLVASRRRDVDRVYTMFPRLAERRSNGGAQLSGGEQQMLAIGRALLLNPKLLVMDEPTEGLAPVIVEQVAQALRELAADGIAVLLIEQNLGVALSVADRIGLMVNGRIAQEMPAAALAADRELQERLLGVRSGGHGDELDAELPATGAAPSTGTQVFTVRRAHGDGAPSLSDLAPATVRGFTRWNAGGTAAAVTDISREAMSPSSASPSPSHRPLPQPSTANGRGGHTAVFDFPVAASSERAAYVVGTFDTKGRELGFLRQCIEKLGLRVVTV
ncbi:MAG: ATP-binding cassette domain-containing protein, partial [Variovorax sp.]|nr:ATP-binding cassette domain-containing protein [Variovorax sp.]